MALAASWSLTLRTSGSGPSPARSTGWVIAVNKLVSQQTPHQLKTVEKLLARARRYLSDFTTEERCNYNFSFILKIADKIQKLDPTPAQLAKLWSVVETAQSLTDQSVETVRVSRREPQTETLNSRDLGAGAIL